MKLKLFRMWDQQNPEAYTIKPENIFHDPVVCLYVSMLVLCRYVSICDVCVCMFVCRYVRTHLFIYVCGWRMA